MAGRSLVFHSLNVSFYKTGTDKMIVSSPSYKFYGNTYAPKLKDCYILNEEGTAFEYTTTSKALPALSPYFTTTLSEELRLPSIVLPMVPEVPDGIKGIEEERFINNNEEATYDLMGRRITNGAGKGIVIKGNKKYLIR